MPRTKTDKRKRTPTSMPLPAVLKVGTRSDPNSVAGAIAAQVRRGRRSVIQTIGAGALNQGVKALAIARGLVAPEDLDIWCYPAFVEVDIDGEERTAIKLTVEPR